MRELLATIILIPDSKDIIIWMLATNRIYTADSAYKAHFMGSFSFSFMNIVWKTSPPIPQVQLFRLACCSEQAMDIGSSGGKGMAASSYLPAL